MKKAPVAPAAAAAGAAAAAKKVVQPSVAEAKAKAKAAQVRFAVERAWADVARTLRSHPSLARPRSPPQAQRKAGQTKGPALQKHAAGKGRF